MALEIRHYLNNMGSRLRLDPKSERDILRELYTHLEEETDELCQNGLNREAAARMATERFGSSQTLAREFHQVYSKGTWLQAFLAALPHLLIALTFILQLWRGWHWMVAILVSMMLVTVYEWRRGKPAWLYPWLGYCLAMMVVLALLLWQVVPNPWLWLLLLTYIPFALWLLASIVFRVVRRDWLLASLMMLPLPVAIGWLLTLEQEGLAYNEQGFHNISPQLALTFLTLGLVTAAFIRLRNRLFKAGLLLAITLIMLIFILPATGAFFISSLLLTSSLLLPKLLERRIGRGQWRNDAWEQLLLEKNREAD